MGSEQSHSRSAAAGALLLAAAAFAAGAWRQPAALAASAAAACAALALLRWGLRQPAARRQAAHELPLEVPPPMPESQHRQLAAQALLAEARLEFAPVPLFRMPGLEPLNASARRLLAPGRAADRAALAASVAGLAAGQRRMVGFETEGGAERALACANAMQLAGSEEQLLALMPMEDELSAEAMQAWQKLVRVLTHEIMNSLTPVASLSKTSRALLGEAPLAPGVAQDLDTALDAISRRADG